MNYLNIISPLHNNGTQLVGRCLQVNGDGEYIVYYLLTNNYSTILSQHSSCHSISPLASELIPASEQLYVLFDDWDEEEEAVAII